MRNFVLLPYLTFHIYLICLQLFCGTEPLPTEFRAKKYKLHKNFITKSDFHHIMSCLPVPVSVEEVEEMFNYADKNKDGKLSYEEFEVRNRRYVRFRGLWRFSISSLLWSFLSWHSMLKYDLSSQKEKTLKNLRCRVVLYKCGKCHRSDQCSFFLKY